MSQTALLRLMLLLSPSFPVGAFAYSSGLEQAVADGLVTDAAGLEGWLLAALDGGSIRNDAILLAEAHRVAASNEALQSVADLAAALAGSKQRHMETLAQGAAFVDAVKATALALPDFADPPAYPVAVGAVGSMQGLEPAQTIAAYLHAFASNQIQCGIRLGVLGQNGGVALLARLEDGIANAADEYAASTLDDLGSNTLMADISAMRHETLYSRIFRS